MHMSPRGAPREAGTITHERGGQRLPAAHVHCPATEPRQLRATLKVERVESAPRSPQSDSFCRNSGTIGAISSLQGTAAENGKEFSRGYENTIRYLATLARDGRRIRQGAERPLADGPKHSRKPVLAKACELAHGPRSATVRDTRTALNLLSCAPGPRARHLRSMARACAPND